MRLATPTSTRRLRATATILASVALGAALMTAAPADARGHHGHRQGHHPGRQAAWAPAATAAITPGTMMYTDGAQCTANFVFTDSSANVYVGYAAHCAGLGGATDTDGCLAPSLPLGVKVTFNEGGSLVDEGTKVGSGTLVYSSWLTEKELGTKDANTCAYNDLALVKVARSDVSKVNPSIPFWGGPTGIDTDGTAAGDQVWTYGNSSLRGGITEFAPHTGISLGDSAADGGWSHPLYTVSPGIPGDSGSAFLSGGGKAIGVLSTLGLAPLPLSNNIGDLAKELAFARHHSRIAGLKLVKGTEPFNPIL